MSVPALLAVAQSDGDRAAADYAGLMERVRAAAPSVDVNVSYVDDGGASILEGLAQLGANGRSVVVVPLFLVAEAYEKGHIPAAIRAARRQLPSSEITYARPLGPHPLLFQAIQRRLDLAKVSRSTAIVFAAEGWSDPDANAEIAKAARLMWEWRRAECPIEPAFINATTPTIDVAIDRLNRLGHSEIAVVSYLLSAGTSAVAIAEAAQSLPITSPFADTSEVASLVLERYVEAVGVSPASSCDTCIYRVSWPSFEHRVGQPQRAR